MANFNTVGLGGSLNTATNVYNLIQQARNNQYQREQIEYAKANANFEKDLDYAQKTFGNIDAVKAMTADGTYDQNLFQTQEDLQARAQLLGRDINVNLHNDWLGDAQGDLYNTVYNIQNAKSKEQAQALIEAYRAKWRGLEPIVNKSYGTIMSEKLLTTNQQQTAGQVPTDKTAQGQLGVNEPSATSKSDMATTTSDINTVFTEQNNMLNNDLNKNTPISYSNMADTVLLQALNTLEANTKLTKQNAIKEEYQDINTLINVKGNLVAAYNYTPEQRANWLFNLSNMENLPPEWKNDLLLINKKDKTPEEESKVNYMLASISPNTKSLQIGAEISRAQAYQYDIGLRGDKARSGVIEDAIKTFTNFKFKDGITDEQIADNLKDAYGIYKNNPLVDLNALNSIMITTIKNKILNNHRTQKEQIDIDKAQVDLQRGLIALGIDEKTADAKVAAYDLANELKQIQINDAGLDTKLKQQNIIKNDIYINKTMNDKGETVINVNGKPVKPTWNKTTGALSISVGNRVTVLDGKQVALLRNKADITNEQIESMGALNATLLSKYASALSKKTKNGATIKVDPNLQTAFDNLKLQATDPEKYVVKKQTEQTVQNKLNILYSKFYTKYGSQNPNDRKLADLVKKEFPKWNDVQRKEFIQGYKIHKAKK